MNYTCWRSVLIQNSHFASISFKIFKSKKQKMVAWKFSEDLLIYCLGMCVLPGRFPFRKKIRKFWCGFPGISLWEKVVPFCCKFRLCWGPRCLKRHQNGGKVDIRSVRWALGGWWRGTVDWFWWWRNLCYGRPPISVQCQVLAFVWYMSNSEVMIRLGQI